MEIDVQQLTKEYTNGVTALKNINLKETLGYVPQNFTLPENLSGIEYLRYMSAAKGILFKEAKKEAKSYWMCSICHQLVNNELLLILEGWNNGLVLPKHY